MKNLLIVLLIILLIAGAYYYVRPDKVNNWLRDMTDRPTTTRVYKWRDPQGNWQITDKPPPEQVEYTVQEYRSDENVLPLPQQLRSNK